MSHRPSAANTPKQDDAPVAPRVAVIGAGGLGGPAALGLAAQGIAVRLIDDDRVELSNLQRQVLFTTRDLGAPKVEVAAAALRARHAEADVEVRLARLASDADADALLDGCALAIDATDDPGARFRINDWALRHRRFAVIGGLARFTGLVVPVGPGFGPCFRCLFEADDPAAAPTCGQLGVIGALAGLVGHLQAALAAELLAGRGLRHLGHGVAVDALAGRIRRFPLPEGTDCPSCGGLAAQVDVRADRCPFTWVRTRLALELLPAGATLAVTLGAGEAARNVAANLRAEGHAVLAEGPGLPGVHHLFARKAG
jgi:molybdopterin/thiamine biosynthesis adenylyltransferase/TusA-related sulfurtransferase